MTASPKRTLLSGLLPFLLVWLSACSPTPSGDPVESAFTPPEPEVATTGAAGSENESAEAAAEQATPTSEPGSADENAAADSPAVDAGSTEAPEGEAAAAEPPAAETAATMPNPERYTVTPLATVHVCSGEMVSSSLSFVSSKDDGVKVSGVFGDVHGGFHLDPTDLSQMTGQLNVALESVDTGNEARDKNIATTLFGWTSDKTVYGDVEFLKVTPSVKKLGIGESTTALAELRINIGGRGSLARVPVGLSHPSEGEWILTTSGPVGLSIKDLGMQGAADTLKKVCGHQLIGDRVEIEASIHLVALK